MFLTSRNTSFLSLILMLCGLLFCVQQTRAQEGHLYLSDYQPDLQTLNKRNYSIVQGDQGVIYMANKKGVLSYNGTQWKTIETPSSVYSLAKHPSGKVFVGCVNSFGYLSHDQTRQSSFIPLLNSQKKVGKVSNIHVDSQHIYFYSKQRLHLYNLKEDTIQQTWSSPPQHPFTGMVPHNNQIFFNLRQKGLCQASDTGFIPLPNGNQFANQKIITILYPNSDSTIIGTEQNQLFCLSDTSIHPYTLKDKEYLLESILSCGQEYNDTTFILGTLAGGCMFIDKQTGTTEHILNYQTGLPDDEIFSIGTDQNNGIWISHGYGITRANYTIPIRKYSSYPGLEGNILSTVRYKGRLYVGTSKGVFHLSEVQNFKELQVYIKKPEDQEYIRQQQKPVRQRPEPKTQHPSSTPPPDTTAKEKKKKKKGLKIFGYRIVKDKKKKKKKKKQPDPQQSDETQTPDVQPQPQQTSPSRYQRPVRQQPDYKTIKKEKQVKKVYALKSVKHIFRQVNGFKGKCTQLVKYKDRLLIASNTGLYEIKEKNAQPIIKGAYVNAIQPSTDTDRIYIGTRQGLRTLSIQNGVWQVEQPFPQFDKSIFSLTVDTEGHLWIGGPNLAKKVSLSPSGIPVDTQTFTFQTNFSRNIHVYMLREKPTFKIGQRFYQYHAEGDSLHPVQELKNSRIIAPQTSYTWLKQGQQWMGFRHRTGDTIREHYLATFDNIQHIFVDKENNLWVVNRNESVYKVTARQQSRIKDYDFNVYLTAIRDGKGDYLPFENLSLNYQQSALSFSFHAPYYINEEATRYQYYLEGSMKDWSEWRRSPRVHFPVLPIGHHTLHLRAKNVYNNQTEEKTFSFVITPPFWRTWWFYLLCLIVGVGAIYGLLKFREKRMKDRQRKLEAEVQKRTQQIRKQNEKITSSINYAKRIQESILPTKHQIKEAFPHSFIFYQPRDIVSGDFYWYGNLNDKHVIAAADCTGHGVPGGFVSMIGHILLNEVVIDNEVTDPGQILKSLHKGIQTSLQTEEEREIPRDGMDIALCTIDAKQQKIHFSGAVNPLFLLRAQDHSPSSLEASSNGVENDQFFLEEIEGNKFSIGDILRDGEVDFQTRTFEFYEGDTVYMGSDGYEDQFGGGNNEKFTTKRLKNLLLDLQGKPMKEQGELIAESFKDWCGDSRQIDDVLLMGIHLKDLGTNS